MNALHLVSPSDAPRPDRLADFGLSVELLHDAMTPGLIQASTRTSLALNSTPGTDLYHTGLEQLSILLLPLGWKRIWIRRQPRILHPDGLLAITLSAAIGIDAQHPGTEPITGKKGLSTTQSLDMPYPDMEALFSLSDTEQHTEAPLWFLLHERHEAKLKLELSRPQVQDKSGRVVGWSERIPIRPIDLGGAITDFPVNPDDPFDVQISLRPNS